MKVTKSIAAALVACCALTTVNAFADEAAADSDKNPVGVYAGTELKSGYLSNGYLFADDPVLQSFAGITAYGFDLNIWNSWNLDKTGDYANPDASNEIDYELDYCYSYGDFDFKVGVASWVYPNTDESFDDWVAKAFITYNGFIVTPEINARFGLDGQQGCYGQFKLSKSFDVAEGLTFDVYGLTAYASKSYRKGKGVDDDGFVDAEFGASLGYGLTDNFSVSAGVVYSIVVDSDLRDAIDEGTGFQADGDKDHFIFYGGISAAF